MSAEKKEPIKKPKKVTQSNDCKRGHHTFVITRWQHKAGFQKAIHMRCQHCLEQLDLDEINWKEWREDEGIG